MAILIPYGKKVSGSEFRGRLQTMTKGRVVPRTRKAVARMKRVIT